MFNCVSLWGRFHLHHQADSHKAAGVGSASFGDRSISHYMALFLPLPCPQGPEGWSPSPALVPPHSPGQGSPGTLISLVLPSDPGFSQRVHRCCFLSRTFSHRIFGCMALSVPLFSCKLVKLSPATTESPSVSTALCLFRTHPGLLWNVPRSLCEIPCLPLVPPAERQMLHLQSTR